MQKALLFCLCVIQLLSKSGFAQQQKPWTLRGRVFDKSERIGLGGVSVLTTSGHGTATDSLGNYSLLVNWNDSVYFSYQNKLTLKYAIAQLEDPSQFNMALHVATTQLPPVTVFGRNYRSDSLQNRQLYAKYFNWRKENPLNSVNTGGGTVGMDPNAIINLFRFRRNKQLTWLRNRLIGEEQTKYVDARYTPQLVKKITGLQGEMLIRFMHKYRPPYDFVAIVNNLELAHYVGQCYRKEMGQLPLGSDVYLLGIDPLELDNTQP